MGTQLWGNRQVALTAQGGPAIPVSERLLQVPGVILLGSHFFGPTIGLSLETSFEM